MMDNPTWDTLSILHSNADFQTINKFLVAYIKASLSEEQLFPLGNLSTAVEELTQNKSLEEIKTSVEGLIHLAKEGVIFRRG